MTAPPAFKDHFSLQSEAYRRFRPDYPAALFEWLAGCTRRAAGSRIDVATGNGQAAVALAEHFESVIATEPSAAQLAQAPAHPRVEYRCEAAESISVAAGSADLLVAAQAAHWFDWPRFVREAVRVLRPGGVLAFWTYGNCLVDPRDRPARRGFFARRRRAVLAARAPSRRGGLPRPRRAVARARGAGIRDANPLGRGGDAGLPRHLVGRAPLPGAIGARSARPARPAARGGLGRGPAGHALAARRSGSSQLSHDWSRPGTCPAQPCLILRALPDWRSGMSLRILTPAVLCLAVASAALADDAANAAASSPASTRPRWTRRCGPRTTCSGT